MKPITFSMGRYPVSPRTLQTFLDALTGFNRALCKAGMVPPLYRADVRYRREGGTEVWRPATVVARTRYGDCEDLACYRAGELQARGIPARAVWRRNRRGGYHIVVLSSNGRTEDPSKRLGM